MLFLYLAVIPILGVLWFVNFISFLKNLKEEKSSSAQNFKGVILTFHFLFFSCTGLLQYINHKKQTILGGLFFYAFFTYDETCSKYIHKCLRIHRGRRKRFIAISTIHFISAKSLLHLLPI